MRAAGGVWGVYSERGVRAARGVWGEWRVVLAAHKIRDWVLRLESETRRRGNRKAVSGYVGLWDDWMIRSWMGREVF